jgi:catechol 2,3-dioxygenase
MSNAAEFFDVAAAPMRIGTVRLKVGDLKAVTAFYQAVLGLGPVARAGRRITLGTGSVPLLTLEGDPALAPSDPRQAGLFHTAFLVPSRGDLARWLAHIAEARVPLQGASDHIVSEAIYLADPEGNGIEVYADRPLSDWRGLNGEIRMSTDPLDRQGLLKAAKGSAWAGFSASTLPRATPARASTAAAAITTSSPATSGTAAAPDLARMEWLASMRSRSSSATAPTSQMSR